jgi:phage terminase large subunit
MTAPAYHQIRNILWPEVSRLYRGARFPIGGILHKDPASGLELPHDRGVICISTDKPERMAGLSGANILFLVDEGSGFPDDLWEPIFGNMAGGGRLLTTGNPTRTSGPFYDAFSAPEFWHLLHVNSNDTPNVRAGKTVIPGLATREWVEDRKREWGEDSAAYQVRVLGNFPTQADNAIIPIGLAHEAQEREVPDGGALVLGVDVARFGDDESVIQPRRGLRAFPAVAVQGMDLMQLAGKVREVVTEHAGQGERPRLNIDEIGVGGGLVDILKSQHPGWDIFGVNVAERATADGFTKLRDQLWFSCRDWLKEGGSIPDDPKLFSELVAPTYSFDAQGRQKVESKDEIKKRLKRSPDRADALCLAVYSGRPTINLDEWVV